YDLAPERGPKQIRRDRLFMRLLGATRYHGGAPLRKSGPGPDGRLPRLEPEWKRLLGIVGAPPEPAPFRLAVPEEARRRVGRRFGHGPGRHGRRPLRRAVQRAGPSGTVGAVWGGPYRSAARDRLCRLPPRGLQRARQRVPAAHRRGRGLPGGSAPASTPADRG